MGIDLSRLGPAAQRQVLQKLQQGGQSAPAAPSKMGNEKTQRVMPGGSVHTFDSQREARRYDELAILLAAGKIRDLRLQQAYTLQGGYISSEGEMIRAITYKADFAYQEPCGDGWRQVVEDAKGFRTDKYIMKRKMMQDRLGITIREV